MAARLCQTSGHWDCQKRIEIALVEDVIAKRKRGDEKTKMLLFGLNRDHRRVDRGKQLQDGGPVRDRWRS